MSESFKERVVDGDGSVLPCLGAGDLDDPLLHVYAIPGKPQDFPPAHPCMERTDHYREQVRGASCKKAFNLVCVKVAEATIGLRQPLDGAEWIHVQVAPGDSFVQHRFEEGYLFIHCGRGNELLGSRAMTPQPLGSVTVHKLRANLR
jgi:hypothetical protein